MKPSIGRIVHFTTEDNVSFAAIITSIVSGTIVSLTVFAPNLTYIDCLVEYSDAPKSGCWSWPPKI